MFVYGTLRDPEIRAAVLNGETSDVNVSAASLPDHELFRVKGRSYPMIVEFRRSIVHGQLLEGLTAEQLRRLDAFEGDEYMRGPILVLDAAGRQLRAQVYRPRSGVRRDRRRWSLEQWSPRERRAMLEGIKAWRRGGYGAAADISAP